MHGCHLAWFYKDSLNVFVFQTFLFRFLSCVVTSKIDVNPKFLLVIRVSRLPFHFVWCHDFIKGLITDMLASASSTSGFCRSTMILDNFGPALSWQRQRTSFQDLSDHLFNGCNCPHWLSCRNHSASFRFTQALWLPLSLIGRSWPLSCLGGMRLSSLDFQLPFRVQVTLDLPCAVRIGLPCAVKTTRFAICRTLQRLFGFHQSISICSSC